MLLLLVPNCDDKGATERCECVFLPGTLSMEKQRTVGRQQLLPRRQGELRGKLLAIIDSDIAGKSIAFVLKWLLVESIFRDKMFRQKAKSESWGNSENTGFGAYAAETFRKQRSALFGGTTCLPQNSSQDAHL